FAQAPPDPPVASRRSRFAEVREAQARQIGQQRHVGRDHHRRLAGAVGPLQRGHAPIEQEALVEDASPVAEDQRRGERAVHSSPSPWWSHHDGSSTHGVAPSSEGGSSSSGAPERAPDGASSSSASARVSGSVALSRSPASGSSCEAAASSVIVSERSSDAASPSE